MLAVMPFSHQCRKSCQYLTEFDVGTLGTPETLVVTSGITFLAIIQRELQLLPVWRPPY